MEDMARSAHSRGAAPPQVCDRCRQKTRSTKKLTVQRFPRILVLRILLLQGEPGGPGVGGVNPLARAQCPRKPTHTHSLTSLQI